MLVNGDMFQWENLKKNNIEEFISGKGLRDNIYLNLKINLLLKIYSKNQEKNSSNEKKMVDEFINNLGLSLSLIINIIDPDAIVFGGGVSNEITIT